jgi:hypothetical protein
VEANQVSADRERVQPMIQPGHPVPQAVAPKGNRIIGRVPPFPDAIVPQQLERDRAAGSSTALRRKTP